MSFWKSKLAGLLREWAAYTLSPSDKIFVLNGFVFKGKWVTGSGGNRGILQTSRSVCVGEEDPALRVEGLSVFAPLDTGIEQEAFDELREIFGAHGRLDQSSSRTCRSESGLSVLFLDKKGQLYMPAVLDQLSGMGYHALRSFLEMHANAIQALTNATDEVMGSSSLTLVRYEAGRGMVAHIDGIGDFKKTFGPIFTIAMGTGPKCLDLLPVLTVGAEPAVRVTTQQFEVIMLQGAARAAYAHCVPVGCDREQFTVAFKFPEITSGRQADPYHCPALGLIPVLAVPVCSG